MNGVAPNDQDAVADRLFRITAALALAAATVVIAGGLVDYFLFDEAIEDLNPKLEGNLLSWASVVAAFAGGLAATLHALIFPAQRWQFAVLGGVLTFLSLDDMILIHERVAARFEQSFFEHVETLIFLPIYATAFLIV